MATRWLDSRLFKNTLILVIDECETAQINVKNGLAEAIYYYPNSCLYDKSETLENPISIHRAKTQVLETLRQKAWKTYYELSELFVKENGPHARANTNPCTAENAKLLKHSAARNPQAT